MSRFILKFFFLFSLSIKLLEEIMILFVICTNINFANFVVSKIQISFVHGIINKHNSSFSDVEITNSNIRFLRGFHYLF